jgi:hypothetical protein
LDEEFIKYNIIEEMGYEVEKSNDDLMLEKGDVYLFVEKDVFVREIM